MTMETEKTATINGVKLTESQLRKGLAQIENDQPPSIGDVVARMNALTQMAQWYVVVNPAGLAEYITGPINKYENARALVREDGFVTWDYRWAPYSRVGKFSDLRMP